jgi:hypothetical protein
LTLVTNDRNASEFPVDVEGRVVSSVTVFPGSWYIGAQKPGTKVTKKLVVQSKKPFRITGVTCDDPERFKFTTADADEPKTVHLVTANFTAGDDPGKMTYRIRIESDLGEDAAPELKAFAHIIGVQGEKSDSPAEDAVSDNK